MSEDKRPYLYANFEAPYGKIELTVEGSEGETTQDISDMFDEKLDRVIEAHREITDEDEKAGVQ